MSQDKSFLTGPMLPSILVGAAFGGVLVALTTPKTGPELRGDLKDIACRALGKAGALAGDVCVTPNSLKEPILISACELKRTANDVANDLPS